MNYQDLVVPLIGLITVLVCGMIIRQLNSQAQPGWAREADSGRKLISLIKYSTNADRVLVITLTDIDKKSGEVGLMSNISEGEMHRAIVPIIKTICKHYESIEIDITPEDKSTYCHGQSDNI